MTKLEEVLATEWVPFGKQVVSDGKIVAQFKDEVDSYVAVLGHRALALVIGFDACPDCDTGGEGSFGWCNQHEDERRAIVKAAEEIG